MIKTDMKNSSATKTILTVLLILCFNVTYGNIVYNILDFGAKNDGSEKATLAIKNAIEAAAENGGGTIFFPAGEYLTGPIHFKSNITLFFDAGSYVRFTNDFEDYLPMVKSRYEGVDVINFSPLFYAYEVENIAITGRGTLDGQGKMWWDTFFKLRRMGEDTTTRWQQEFLKLNEGMMMPDGDFMYRFGFLRPPFFQPMYCENVLVEGVTVKNAPFWTINPEFCNNITVTGVTINNPPSPNTDGINPESCSNVHISDCHISVGDDCITIKSGKDAPGRAMARPAENYTITNCTMLSGHGGVVIGSEMSGDVKKIVISNCVFDGTDRGIRIKSTRGRGGVVEDIQVSNIIAKNIKREIFMFNLYYSKSEHEPVSERTPQFRNIHISNVTGTAKQVCAIKGLDEMPVRDLSFSNIDVDAEIGFTMYKAENIRISNAQISCNKGPTIKIENSSRIELGAIQNPTPLPNVPVIELFDVKEAFIYNCYQPIATDVFVSAYGKKTERVFIKNNQQHHTKSILQIGKDLTKGAVVLEE